MQAIALGRSLALGRRRPSHMCLVCVCLGLGIEHGAGMNATCIMGQAVCRRACTQHAGSMQQAVKNAACCIYAKCLVLARCIFHSMHSAFSQHAAHCVLSSRISHCSHPFAGPIRSSAPSRQVAPNSEKCSILHVASSSPTASSRLRFLLSDPVSRLRFLLSDRGFRN